MLEDSGHNSNFLRGLFAKAVEVADPMRVLEAHLPPRSEGRVIVVGAGKASARMAEAVEARWGPCEGLVITRYGYARPCAGIEIVEAAHPVPDEAGVEATARLVALLDGLGENDFVLALISGGASSLLVAPVQGVGLADKRAFNAALLASGAPISVMNALRKRLSRVKGGHMAAAAYPARMRALIVSDVPGDDPSIIGSGPTVGDNAPGLDITGLLESFPLELPARVREALLNAPGPVPADDVRLSRVENVIVAAPARSLAAAADLARAMGCEARLLGDDIEGEARDVARHQAALALEIQRDMKPGDRPVLLLSGGELTVTRRGGGTGGPNAEFCLALAIALDGAVGIEALSCDTDGVDGAAEVAGAVIGPDTLGRARAVGLDPRAELDDNNAHTFFAAVGGQVVTGPTLTNVNDFRAVLILGRTA
ncbi:MAG: glycerate kinase [Rhodospirillum sp.]|nr:glycerate kinase [Rhodospirillum sp.]MCF8489452.1 glycerate kinase [Rhodospirillum sp.]MCF8500966.1 glycerate kinase [Rhodospirillum sp.]